MESQSPLGVYIPAEIDNPAALERLEGKVLYATMQHCFHVDPNAQRNIRRRQATIIQKCQELSQLGVQVFLVMQARGHAHLLNTSPHNVLFHTWDRETDRAHARVIRVRPQRARASRPLRLIDRLEPPAAPGLRQPPR